MRYRDEVRPRRRPRLVEEEELPRPNVPSPLLVALVCGGACFTLGGALLIGAGVYRYAKAPGIVSPARSPAEALAPMPAPPVPTVALDKAPEPVPPPLATPQPPAPVVADATPMPPAAPAFDWTCPQPEGGLT
jgi:hypothetical protein